MRRALALTLALALVQGCSPLFYVALKVRESNYPRRELTVDRAVAGNTDQPDRRLRATCAGRSEADPSVETDQVWHFRPATNGRYRVRVAGGYDTAVAVYHAADELGCNDDGPTTTDAELTLPLRAGEDYLVVVDGYKGDHGAYTLAADLAPDAPSLLRTPVEDSGNTARRCHAPGRLALGLSTGLFLAESGTLASCGGRGVGTEYQLDVPEAGVLRVTEVSPFTAVLQLRSVCTEAHSALACARHGEGTRYVVLTARVEPGTYFLVLDATQDDARGPFALDVQLDTTGAAPEELPGIVITAPPPGNHPGHGRTTPF